MSGPLDGLRGLVLTQAWAGSYCTELLAMLGADVIQIEVRRRPDSWRGSYDAPLPEALRDVPTAEHAWNCNPLYNSVNLSKRCVTLDLQDPEALDLFKRLLVFADFVAENFSPRVMGNLGLSYEALRAVKPDIVVCSLSAYGHEGPWANVPGIGGTIEPTSGMSGLLGYRDGPPLNSGQMYPDAVAGMYGAAAILTALHHRDRTGEGQYIDLSMQEANLTFIGDAVHEAVRLGRQRPRLGNRHLTFAPHGIFACAGDDRWIALACENDAQWTALCALAGRGWEGNPDFASNGARKANEDALEAAIAAWTANLERDPLEAALQGAGVPAAAVLDAHDLAADPSLRERGLVVETVHPEVGRLPQVGLPLRFSRSRLDPPRAAPLLGEHSFEVFREFLGVTEDDYERLAERGVSGTGPPPGVRGGSA